MQEQRSNRLARQGKAFAAALALMASSLAFADGAGKTYYVDAGKGSASNSGLSQAEPFASIQQAAKLATAGDCILVGPGVYLERVVLGNPGKEGAPLVIKSVAGPAKTVISAADPAIRRGEIPWKLEDKELQLYSIPFQQNPARVLYSGTDLFPYPSLDGLKEFALPANKEFAKAETKTPGIEHGCYFDGAAKLLYVRLHADGKFGPQDPAKHVMSVSPPHAPGSNGHHVSRPEESCLFIASEGNVNMIVDGFTFETPGAAGVITAGGNVVIRNCSFKGCRFGVFGKNRPEAVFIENCHYDQAYVFEDMAEVLKKHGKNPEVRENNKFFWWQRKYNYDNPNLKNYETGLPGGVGKNWHIRDNVVEEAFEGMSCWAIDESENAQVYGNSFKRLIDNAVETENHNKNMRVFNNRVEDVFEAFSWQPLGGLPWPGPVFIYRNIVTSSPAMDGLWPTWRPGVFKIGAADRNWDKPHMGTAPVQQPASRISKRFVMVPYPGFLAFNNTIVCPYSSIFTIPMPAARDLVNFRFFNNIFMTAAFHNNPHWKGSLFEFYSNIELDRQQSPENPHAKIAAGRDGVSLSSEEGVFAKLAGGDFRLAQGSPAIGKGVTTLDEIDASLDLGAIPYGSSWALAAGPGAAIPEKELTAFQTAVRYNAEFVRTAGPRPGLWGVYSPERQTLFSLPSEMDAQGNHEISATFRRTGEKGLAPLASIPNALELSIDQKDAASASLKLELKGGSPSTTSIELAQRPLHEWREVRISWKEGSALKISVDGAPVQIQGAVQAPPMPRGKADVKIAVHRIPLLDVKAK